MSLSEEQEQSVVIVTHAMLVMLALSAIPPEIQEFLDRRALIVTGDVTIDGRLTNVVGDRTISQQNIHSQYLFDHSADSVRVEFEVHDLRMTEEEAKRQGVEWKPPRPRPIRVVEVYSGDKVLRMTMNSRSINIGPRPAEKLNYWDLRTLGIASYDDLLNGTPLPVFLISFERYDGKGFPPTIEEDPDTGLPMITLTYPGNPPETLLGRRRIWFDRKLDWAPVRMEQQLSIEEGVWREPSAISTATYETVNGFHVPATVIVESVMRPDNQPLYITRYELALKWHSCNEPIEVGIFDLSSLDVPRGSHVITEHRIGEPPVMIQHPSFPNPESLRRVQEANAKPSRPIQSPPAAPQRSSRTLWLVGINIVLFLGLAGLAIARRRTRP